ncbi:MAG: hypothetical protein HYT38_00105 [Candidatus Sungbacteria bacterium]|uniref:Uncharacterized protein n=1 Tax=Candidatus Sungiibacteriota bacterium TaxID=2750080 RepID=A0A931YDA2_9BACT|nr:hypothetical protein [Candidatus Sungbacteria bacterium]MBI2465818.1 hypothetical protein [Candidatus Sungbacteria bacterium]
MDAKKQLLYACALAVILILTVAGIAHYGLDLERNLIILIVFPALATSIGIVTILPITNTVRIAVIIAFATTILTGIFVTFATITAASFIIVVITIIIFITAFAKHDLPFSRMFGCLLAEAEAIGLGLYFLSNPAVVVSTSVMCIAWMLTSLYLPCPRFLHWTAKPENGAG